MSRDELAPAHDDGPPSRVDFGLLVQRVEKMERTVSEVRDDARLLQRGHEQLISQMAELGLNQLHEERARKELAGKVEALSGKVDENTGVTLEVLKGTREIMGTVRTLRDVQAAGRLWARFFRWVGRNVRAVVLWGAPLVTAVAGAWWAWRNGGPKP